MKKPGVPEIRYRMNLIGMSQFGDHRNKRKVIVECQRDVRMSREDDLAGDCQYRGVIAQLMVDLFVEDVTSVMRDVVGGISNTRSIAAKEEDS